MVKIRPVGDAAELIEEYKGKKIKRGKRDDAVSVEGIGNAPRYFTGWSEAARVTAAKVAIDKYLATQPKQTNTLLDKANRDIQRAVRTGELDADSDASEIRQVLSSYPKEVQEHFVRDMGRIGDEFASPLPPEALSTATDALTDAEKEWLRYYEGRARVGALRRSERKDYEQLLQKEKSMAKDSKKRVGDANDVMYKCGKIHTNIDGEFDVLMRADDYQNRTPRYYFEETFPTLAAAKSYIDKEARSRVGDELLPVGNEPDKAAAIAAHNAGLTKSQDDLEPVGDTDDTEELAQRIKQLVRELKADGTVAMGKANLKQMVNTRGLRFANANHFERAFVDALGKAGVGKFVTDELPYPIKPVGLVPLPSGAHNEESYAPIPVGDSTRKGGGSDQSISSVHRVGGGSDPGKVVSRAADAIPKWQPDSPNHEELNRMHAEVVGKGYKPKYVSGGMETGSMQHVYRKGGNENTRPTAIIKERKKGNHEVVYRDHTAKATDSMQRSGSAPEDHLFRARQYEIQGDRARALDSYRAAASGYRKSGSSAKIGEEGKAASVGLAKAVEGVAACQAAFDSQYVHPSAGRTRVCDSAEQAVESAIQRTRAGESVRVEGMAVRPVARVRGRDAEEKNAYGHKGNTYPSGAKVNLEKELDLSKVGKVKDTAGVSARWFKSEQLANTYAKGLKATEGISATVEPDEGGWEVSWTPELGFAADVMPVGDATTQKWRVLLDNMDEGSVETDKKADSHTAAALARKKYPGFGKVVGVEKSAKATDDTGGGPPVDEPKDAATLEPVPTGDAALAIGALHDVSAEKLKSMVADPGTLPAIRKMAEKELAKRKATGQATDARSLAHV